MNSLSIAFSRSSEYIVPYFLDILSIFEFCSNKSYILVPFQRMILLFLKYCSLFRVPLLVISKVF